MLEYFSLIVLMYLQEHLSYQSNCDNKLTYRIMPRDLVTEFYVIIVIGIVKGVNFSFAGKSVYTHMV